MFNCYSSDNFALRLEIKILKSYYVDTLRWGETIKITAASHKFTLLHL